ncbi:Unknown protein, partial [Striga hermonthica]
VDGRAERRARGHPFSADILAAPLPNNYKDTNLVFDGISDPSRHVRTFENMAVLHGYTDPVSCRSFLSTLRGGALDWFQQLPPGSIVDFEDFAEKLTNQYSSAVAQEKMYLTLMAMRQGEKESLRKYVARYNQACLEILSAVDEVKAGGLIRSLRAGPCRTSLAKTPSQTYDEVMRRCRKYINLEETEAEFAKLEELGRGESRKEKAVSPKRKTSPRREGRVKQDRGREDRWKDRPISGGKRFHDYTPLNAKVAEVLMAMEKGIDGKDVTWPRSRFEGPTQPKSRRYCHFHKDYGHTTEDCRHLKDEIERLIRAGHLKEFVYQDKGRRKEKRRCREDSVERSEEDDDEDTRGGRDGRKRDEGKRRRGSREREREGDIGQVKRGTIYMISGGPTDGDSNNARRGHVRAMKRKREEVSIATRMPVISFKAEDAEGVVLPHNDALVITAEVA